MKRNLEPISYLIKVLREARGLTQEDLAAATGVSRTVIAHIEQGEKIPNIEMLNVIWKWLQPSLELDEVYTEVPTIVTRFESALSEFIGQTVSLSGHTESVQAAAYERVQQLFNIDLTSQQALDLLNSILVYYGMKKISVDFFERYIGVNAFNSPDSFLRSTFRYQIDALRLFSTFREAYIALNSSESLDTLLAPLMPRKLDDYHARAEWNVIEVIPDERLPDLGYISAQRVNQENHERLVLKKYLEDLAKEIRNQGVLGIGSKSERTKRKIDTLLRKFDSRIEHGIFSPLFAPDPGALEREAVRLAPKSSDELDRMAITQGIALRNLSHYLTADYMDVYIATSMRTDADFVSVNQFIASLFSSPDIKRLRLRYFNPTQSWIEDRIAKGLVEALMLKRANFTIYMAQKTDTFGKDSEASVALGQGKSVIVYVPKFTVESDATIDTELLFRQDRATLLQQLRNIDSSEDIDESLDEQGLIGKVLYHRIKMLSDLELNEAIRRHWADFDLYSEADRIKDNDGKDLYRSWLDEIRKSGQTRLIPPPEVIRDNVYGILVATAIRFEVRAKLFREVHPLALQVILSSGVLNGILVVRSSIQCAKILCSLVENKLELERRIDDKNYRLVEKQTDSTIRVITRHQLIQNAFYSFYEQSG